MFIPNLPRTDVDEVKRRLGDRIDDLVLHLFPEAKRSPRDYRIGSLDGEKGTSLSISRRSDSAGLWKDHNASGSGEGDILELISNRFRFDFPATLDWARQWLGMEKPSNNHKPKPTKKPGETLANPEYLERRKKLLQKNEEAFAYLVGRGLKRETIDRFNLGLSEPYTDSEGITREGALVAPLINSDGKPTKQSVYYTIPNVTKNPVDKNGWMKGSPQTYYADAYRGQKTLFVCEGLKDLWITWQEIQPNQSELDILFISSTHGSGIPEEWHQSAFWSRFDHVFLGHDNDDAGESMAKKIAAIGGAEMHRVIPPKGKDWNDFWQAGGTIQEFQLLLAEATVVGQEIRQEESIDFQAGRFSYQPVDIATAFHHGHLYYPVRTLFNAIETVRNERGQEITRMVSRQETVVVRSDRTVHAVKEEPAPKGTPIEDRVLRLTDGTLISSRPKASDYSTWSWASINSYKDGKSKTRPLPEILREVKAYLKSAVWLPYEWDYDLLTLLVPVTYAQAVFQAVPMVLVVGPPGSGKSELGRAMCNICANAVSVGQVSAAAVARLINDTKGFVVLDDLEAIGHRSGRDQGQFTELVQALKLSYKKETSWKLWTDVSKGMRVERLNFFGVKMINNTTGADNILGSRMLRIQTRKLPAEHRSQMGVRDFWDTAALNSIRDDLHTWVFENVELIARMYTELFPQQTDRADEIAAPLRVFAKLANDEELQKGLEQALSVKTKEVADPDDPLEVLREAVRRLVREGYRNISPTHVVLEMRRLIDQNSDRSFTNEVLKWEDPAWVGRQLRAMDIVNGDVLAERQMLYGKFLRIYPVRDHFILEVFNGEIPEIAEQPAVAFCAGCISCPYNSHSCPMMDERMRKEKAKKPRKESEIIGH